MTDPTPEVVQTILVSLRESQRAVRDYPIGDRGFVSYEMKQERLGEIDKALAWVRSLTTASG